MPTMNLTANCEVFRLVTSLFLCLSVSFPEAGAAAEPTIVAVGDSLTAGFGVAKEDAYPALLEKKLRQAGYRYRVVNAGVSGETTRGALSRIDSILKLHPEIVILESGANDGMRGSDPQLIENNLDTIVTRLQKDHVVVVLAGMEMFPALGRDYAGSFAAAYRRVAEKHRIIVIPFFLKRVAGDPALNQGDLVHPTAAGYRIVTETVYPYVVQAIEKARDAK
ncbi:arylesterase [Geomesophilobacter sediminis]|uniref:Arylesterase n=1 Tax=Geomesophilobacter sediminis TaxID=2798584 RepID=A0A8J7M0P6_9BACT|nr:arylesterase [Geomesophilobacter sediminis]MBJ6726282.1 arylesterase [Geomesophilobacter sediminis]